ncbi:hypothetical protein Smic_82480 [Streptomyces microflavus]|uniref:Uncharacterized protein n=1 Tax=Streptomyces microflavus TaxID=1919 RepID=A0A7J0D4N3_STRMI|nr:hypothetical protein Smic_82480 [Streptomyces microflavus]
MSSDLEKPRRKWTSAESAQVWLTVVGILVAIIALVGSSFSTAERPRMRTGRDRQLHMQRARSRVRRPGS